jgi:hypothetical protein
MSEREESVRAFMRDLAEALTGKDLREIAELAPTSSRGACRRSDHPLMAT